VFDGEKTYGYQAVLIKYRVTSALGSSYIWFHESMGI